MKREEFEYLISDEARLLIEKHLKEDPAALALRGIPALICTQIKYLNRCKYKLPQYYNVRAIIPPLSYEQSSSEATSLAREYKGASVLELTCGLGVDAWGLSRNFEEVVTIERDELLADIAKYNFTLLGVQNITVICNSAEEFVKNYESGNFSLIYADPARRNEDSKVVLIEDCSPDILSLMPYLTKISSKISVKLSPMFDVEQAHRSFSSYGEVTVNVVSVAGECKETVVEVDTLGTGYRQTVTVIDSGGKVFNGEGVSDSLFDRQCNIFAYKYLIIPDVSVYKSRILHSMFRDHDVCITAPNGVVLSNSIIDTPWCRCFYIESVIHYKNKEIKRYLKQQGIKTAIIMKRNTINSIEQIKRDTGLKDGSGKILMFTDICNVSYCLTLKQIL